ncbi:MAG TPA: hypothetical protein VHR15_16895 [Ktedonobacterales bacterium]|jgi:hypothetical protein|nr:hypothetical protein [Ktedonobacterales bacterium]
MQSELWQDYGAPGTQALGREEVEQAIARLKRVWDDAQAHAQNDIKIARFNQRKSATIAANGRLPDRLTTHAR